MRVVSKSREAIERLERIMNYKDDEFYCYRVRGFDMEGEIEGDGVLFRADFYCDSAWCSGDWFTDFDSPETKIVVGYERDDSGNYISTKPIFGKAHYTSVTHLCRMLGLGVEMWSTEPGMCFAEHAGCDHNGVHFYETEDYTEEYPEDKDGKVLYECQPTVRCGFGDKFGKWRTTGEIYGDEEAAE